MGVNPVDIDVITASTELSDLQSDSLDTIELLMELENEFGITIPDSVYELGITLGELIRLIEQRRGHDA